MKDIFGLLHLARKAGRLTLGQVAALEKAKSDENSLILIVSDAGNALLRKFENFNVVRIDKTSDELGEMFNREKLSVIVVSDRNLIKEIIKRLNSPVND